MSSDLDVFNGMKKLKKKLENMIKDAIPEEDKPLIIDFCSDLILDNKAEDSIASYANTLRWMSRDLAKGFLKCNKGDYKNFLLKIHQREDLSQQSKTNYKHTLNTFLKWLKKTRKFKIDIKIKLLSSYESRVKSKKELPTEPEVEKMIRSATILMIKLIISLLNELGLRSRELREIKIADISYDEYGAIVKIHTAKTRGCKPKTRHNRLVNSYLYLVEYLTKEHPDPKNGNAFLVFNGNCLEPMPYMKLYSIVKKAGKDAGIDKNIYPHIFRHKRYTQDCKKLPPDILNGNLGLVKGSSMGKAYEHLDFEDRDEVTLRINHGIEKNTNEEDALKSKKCPVCEILNPHNNPFCGNCKSALDEKIVEQQKEKKRKWEIFQKHWDDPDFDKVLNHLDRTGEVLPVSAVRLDDDQSKSTRTSPNISEKVDYHSIKKIISDEIDRKLANTQVLCNDGNCKICPKCKKSNSDEAKYCINCGAQLCEDEKEGGERK